MLNFQNERIPQNKTVNIAQDLESIRKIRWVVCQLKDNERSNLKVNVFNIYKYSCFIHYIYYIIHFTNA